MEILRDFCRAGEDNDVGLSSLLNGLGARGVFIFGLRSIQYASTVVEAAE